MHFLHQIEVPQGRDWYFAPFLIISILSINCHGIRLQNTLFLQPACFHNLKQKYHNHNATRIYLLWARLTDERGCLSFCFCYCDRKRRQRRGRWERLRFSPQFKPITERSPGSWIWRSLLWAHHQEAEAWMDASAPLAFSTLYTVHDSLSLRPHLLATGFKSNKDFDFRIKTVIFWLKLRKQVGEAVSKYHNGQ